MKGWRFESSRHALAARGVKTNLSLLKSRAITKVRGVDFDTGEDHDDMGRDLVLSYEEVWGDDSIITDDPEFDPDSGHCIYELTHPDGWVIKAKIITDWSQWVEDFEASHPMYGRVWGNFNNTVYADTEEGFNKFYENHKPESHWMMDE